MAVSRYWRLVGISTRDNGPLELSELRLYVNGALADAGAAITSTIAPSSGSLAELKDGSAASLVSWPYASYSAAGFALVWDFGAGQGVEAVVVRLGSGSSEGRYIRSLLVQSSNDGLTWVEGWASCDLSYPGANTLGPLSLPPGDPYYPQVALLLSCDGANGSTTFVDGSPAPATLVATTGLALTTSQSKFGGSSLQVTSTAGKIAVTKGAAVNLTGNYTIEAWVRTTAATTSDAHCLMTTNDNVYPSRFLVDWYAPTPTTLVGRVAGASNNPIYTSPSQPYVLGEWAHIAYVNNLADSTFKVFINGVLAGSRALVPLFSATTFQIGKNSTAWVEPAYQMDDICITPGVARYTTTFTPPAARQASTGGVVSVATPAISSSAPMPARLLPLTELPSAPVQGHLREHPFFDAYNGGIGIIYGTTKEKHSPANTPLRRKVLLLDERSQMAIRETWSDAITGYYEFRGVKQGVPYTVISYDHTGAYCAVVADAQLPELIV